MPFVNLFVILLLLVYDIHIMIMIVYIVYDDMLDNLIILFSTISSQMYQYI